jgi:3-methyladenine DNA glycosylase AlkD
VKVEVFGIKRRKFSRESDKKKELACVTRKQQKNEEMSREYGKFAARESRYVETQFCSGKFAARELISRVTKTLLKAKSFSFWKLRHSRKGSCGS